MTGDQAAPGICRWTGSAVVFLVAIAFLPLFVGGFDFVNLDDATGIYQNPNYRGLSMSHLQWMFTTPHMGHYQPLTWVSLGMDFTLGEFLQKGSGMDPGLYHRTNLVFHLANAYLVYVLFTLLLRRGIGGAHPTIRWAAAFGALVFALHPLRVESVAWVTERRDVLSGMFYLLALSFYVRCGEKPATKVPYLYCLLFFVLSMFAKAWGVTFVAVLLLMDAFPLRRFGKEPLKRILLEKIPFLVISVVFMFLARWAQSEAGAMRAFTDYGFVKRMAQAAYGLCFYVVETVWPANLYPMYELDVHDSAFSAVHLLCFAAVAAVSVLLIVYRRKVPWMTVSWFTYACIVAPVLGFAQSGPQKVADRYTYLPCLPFALLAAGALLYWLRKPRRRANSTNVAPIAAGVLILLLGILTNRQLGIWRNSVSLWEHSVGIDPQSHISLFNLAKAYEDQARYDDAIRLLRLALEVKPQAARPRSILGILLADKKQQYRAAMTEFGVLLKHHPKHAEAHFCIGVSLTKLNQDPAARNSFLAAVRLDNKYAVAHEALGDVYLRLGDRRKAAHHRRIAAGLKSGAGR